jgi:peptidoglycan-associated lipoprotein
MRAQNFIFLKKIVISSLFLRGTGLLFLFFLSNCNYTLKIRDGKTAFARKQYATAIPMLQKEFAKAKTRSERGKLAFLTAESFTKTGEPDHAILWYRTASENNFGSEALKAVAFSLKKTEKYPEAGDAFKQLGQEIGSPYEYKKEMANCKIAAEWKAQTERSGVSLESVSFNSAANEFGTARFSDGRLAFTSDRATAMGKEKYRWTGEKFMDIFLAEPTSTSAQLIDNQLNTTENEGSPCFANGGQTIYFVRTVAVGKSGDKLNKIFVSNREGDSWDAPEMLDFQKEKVNYSSPAMSADGSTLYFASDDSDGQGGLDLFFVRKKVSDEWDAPIALPRSLNTSGNENFPTFEADTLYFSSDGLAGMGGLDIFKTYKMDKNNWSPPQNLRTPINSGNDDFGILFEKKSKLEKNILAAGWFTSNRSGGKGGDDIYFFTKKTAPPETAAPIPPSTPKDTVKKEIVYRMTLEGYVLEKIFINPDDPNSKILGRRPLGGSEVVIAFGKNKKLTKIGDDGFFKLDLEEASDYQFVGSKTGYLTNSTKFSTRGIARDPNQPTQNFEIEIVLDRIFKEKEIVLDNIYYDYDKSEIRADAEPTLNKLAEVLQQNPTVKIQLGSHTDCRGQENYNENLSQKRAESAVNFLILKGISSTRLVAKGYGESAPAVSCNCAKCSEDEHQANRRTTFKVVE